VPAPATTAATRAHQKVFARCSHESDTEQTSALGRDEHTRGDLCPAGVAMERYLHGTVNGETTFDPEAVRVLAAALDDAWRSLQKSGVYFTSRGHAEATRERLALRIIEMAKVGGAMRHVCTTMHSLT
jgi:hypothetical protein